MLNSTEELGVSGVEEEIPECSEGEQREILRIDDGPNVPRLSKQEKKLLMSCERSLYVEEWRGMSKVRKWGTLENAKMA